MSTGKFLTFPLWTLAMVDLPEKERLQSATSFSMWQAGANPDTVSDAEVLGYVAKHPAMGYNHTNSDEHKQIVRGAIIIGVDVGSLSASAKRIQELKKFVAGLELRHGPGPIVFISSDLFWGCHDNNDPNFRDFSTLCAINSVVGFKKTPVLIRREMIIARQLGYKSPAVMRKEMEQRVNLKPLTTKQLRDTLDSLESRELICRCQASRRCVYFSTSMEAEDLRAAVKTMVEERVKVRLRRDIDREVFKGATRGPLEGHLKRKVKKSAEKGPLKNEGPLEGHNGTTTGATGGATGGATKTNAFKEVPLQQVRINDEHARSSLNRSKDGTAGNGIPTAEQSKAFAEAARKAIETGGE